MRFYTYNPTGPVFQGPYVEGDTFLRIDTGTPVVCQGVAVPEWGLYEATEDNSACPPYYQPPTKDLAFSGTVGSAAARVVETVVCTQISLDDLLARKTEELDLYAQLVTYQSVRLNDGGVPTPFWLELSQRQRERIFGSVTGTLFDRCKDRTLAEDSSVVPPTLKTVDSYWARNPRLRLIRDSNGNRLLAEFDEVAWGNAVKDAALYDDQIETAYATCTNDLDTAYQAADWNALAAIDVESYAWPAFYTGTTSLRINVVTT